MDCGINPGDLLQVRFNGLGYNGLTWTTHVVLACELSHFTESIMTSRIMTTHEERIVYTYLIPASRDYHWRLVQPGPVGCMMDAGASIT